MKIDKWIWIPGWEGYYKINLSQQIKSVTRKVNHWRGGVRIICGKILTQFPDKDGYPTVKLTREGVTRNVSVHKLMLLSFIGPCPKGMMCRHLNDIKEDNKISNLDYGTNSQNQLDAIRNGRYNNVGKHPNSLKGVSLKV